MAEKRFNFTESRLEKVHQLPKGRLVLYDTEQKGLCLIVMPTGAKSFYVRRTHQGKPIRYHIGVLGEVTLKTARERARDFLSKLAEDNNLHAAKQKLRRAMTLGEFYDVYLEKYAKLNKKSWKTEDYLFRAYVKPGLANTRLTHIRPEDIKQLRSQVMDKGSAHSMTKLMTMLKCVYKYAIERGEFSGTPPTDGVKLVVSKARERFLSGDELRSFLMSLEAEPNKDYQDFFYLCLLTGARKSNILEMQWNEVDFDRAMWRIPETKNGSSLEVPLDVVPMGTQPLHFFIQFHRHRCAEFAFAK